MNKIEVENYLRKCLSSLKSVTDDCQYLSLEEYNLYLVSSYCEDAEGVITKIASNVSKLQCDYDTDWLAPIFTAYSDACLVEIKLHEESIDAEAKYLMDQFKYIKNAIKRGTVKVL